MVVPPVIDADELSAHHGIFSVYMIRHPPFVVVAAAALLQ